MNRLTIFLLASVAVLLSGVAGRHPLENEAARSHALPMASAPASIPTPVAAHAVAAPAARRKVLPPKAVATVKTSAVATSSRQTITGEIPDDYVYPWPANTAARNVGASRTASAAPRAMPTTASVKPVVSPSRKPSTATPTYERAVAEATTIGTDDLNRAARRLEFITAEDPARPEAYEKLAAIRLQQGDFYQAYEMYASAVRKGGKASFSVLHDHTRGGFNSGPNDTCAGELSVLPDKLMFEGADGHGFAVGWAELLEAGSNRFAGAGIGGFHVKLGANKNSRNFNLAPRSRDKREANIILDLLIARAEQADAGK